MDISYTPAELVVIIAALSGAIVNIIGVWRNGTKTDKVAAAVMGKPNTEETGLVGQIDKIHTLTNSGMTEVKNELKIAIELNKELKIIIEDLRSERDKKEMKDAFTAVPLSKSDPNVPIIMEVKKMEVTELLTGVIKDKK